MAIFFNTLSNDFIKTKSFCRCALETIVVIRTLKFFLNSPQVGILHMWTFDID